MTSQVVDVRSEESAGAKARPRGAALPPVVLLGGEANALSVVRDLGPMGVKVYFLGDVDSTVPSSRYCRRIEADGGRPAEEAWAEYLLGDRAQWLHGAVVLTCSDAGIQVLLRHREALAARYLLDDSNPAAQRAMLDKLTTYQHAKAAGVTTPKFWAVSGRAEVEAVREELVFPLLVKPRLSHQFEAKFGKKYLLAKSFEELLAAFDAAADARLEVLLMEWIPGGDDCLCSYYTYIDEEGRPLFDFTKRIIRRYPVGMGTACYHITDWIPELVEPANRLFAQVGLRGLGNVEFKRDPRDGRYKLIECNARFTASNCLVSASGFSLAKLVYSRLAGLPEVKLEHYRRGLRLWDPARDWSAYRQLSGRGEMSFGQWLKSVLHWQTFPYFRWTDPMPAVARATKPLRRQLGRWAGRCRA